MRIITDAEARELIANDDGGNLPYRAINDTGKAAVAQFVHDVAADPGIHQLEAWYTDAEDSAENATDGESIVIEMRGNQTASGSPETVRLREEHFDWLVDD